MRLRHIATLLGIPMLFLVSCSKDRADIPVAKIKDRTISLAAYEATYSKVDPKFLPETRDLAGRKQFLDTIINKEILAIKADELGFDKDEYVVEGMKAFRKVGLQAGYTKYKVGDRINADDKALKAYYKNYGLTYHIKQILLDTEIEAIEVKAMLDEGQDFESMCREFSRGPDASEGGKVVNAVYGTFPPRFQEELFSRKVGEITNPIISQYGYFVIKVVDETRSKQRPFEEVKEDLKKLVENQQSTLFSQEMAEDIRARAGFQMYEANIGIAFEALPPDRPLTNPPNRDNEVYPLLRVSIQDLDKPLVNYKEKTISIKDFSDLYDRASFFQRPRRQYRHGDIKKFLIDVVMNELVEEEMETSGIENDPKVALLLNRKKEQLMVDKLYQDLVDGQTQISYEEIQEYYTANLEQFRRGEERRFATVLTGDRESCFSAYNRIKAGENFERVSTALSVPELKDKVQTDDRYLTKGSQPEFDEYGFSLASVGDFSEPFETSQGWAIIKLKERRPERILSVSEAQHDVTRYLKTLANEERLNELLAKWRGEMTIEIFEKNLQKAKLQERSKQGVSFS